MAEAPVLTEGPQGVLHVVVEKDATLPIDTAIRPVDQIVRCVVGVR